jgi:MFS transporter, DHA1 family, tetracycline resistance protein
LSAPTPQSKGSLFIVFLTVFIDLLGFGIVLPLLPIYAKSFNVDASGWTIGFLMGSFSAMQFLFAPIWGRLSDRYGRRPILLIGLTGSVLFYSMFGLATSMSSLTWMFVSRFGAGIAGATIPTAQAYIADSTTKENRTRGMALIGAAFGLGFTFGPLLAATALFTAGDAAISPWPGYTAAGLSAFALILALLKLPESRQPDSSPTAHRLFDLPALREALSIPTVGVLLLTSFVAVLSFAMFESILSFLLKEPPKEPPEVGGFGFELIDVLLLFALVGFVHALGQGMVRRIAKSVPEANLATLGAVTSIIGFLLLVIATSQGSLPLLLTGMIVEAFGFAFIPASIQSLISRRSDPARQGGILGVAQSLSSLARIGGHVVSFPLFYLTATAPFWTAAGLMGLAAVLITAVIRRGKDFEAAV